MKTILLAGGSGFIGRYLIEALLEAGHTIHLLSRTTRHTPNVKNFQWNPRESFIDENALEGITDVINLCGANIFEKRWHPKQKIHLQESRLNPIDFLFKTITAKKLTIKSFIGISAIGYYGAVTSNQFFDETTPPKQGDFASKLCVLWEEKSKIFETITRTSIIRVGIVLGAGGGILRQLSTQPIVAPLGSGKQWFPWISAGDVARILVHALTQETVSGIYNAVAPTAATHLEFMRLFSNKKGRVLFPAVPAFILNLLLGSRAKTLLNGTRIASEKIRQTGFEFEHPSLKEALKVALD